MEPATYSLLEAMVRAMCVIAEHTLTPDASKELQTNLTSKLTATKATMQRDLNEDVVQAIAATVMALSKFVLGSRPTSEAAPVKKKHLQAALKDLEKRYRVKQKITDAFLHPTGRCTCAGEGQCEWCQSHCVYCGMTLEAGECPHRCSTLCGLCGLLRYEHEDHHRWVDPEHMIGEAPEEPTIDNKVDLGVDPKRWKVLPDMDGNPVVALYFNSRGDSLSLERVEQLEAVIRGTIATWG